MTPFWYVYGRMAPLPTVFVIPRMTLYNMKKNGICNSIGRHPEAGFTLCSL